MIALDATNGKKSWDVNGCPNTPYASTANTFFSIAAYVYQNKVILGHKIWDWHDPRAGSAGTRDAARDVAAHLRRSCSVEGHAGEIGRTRMR